MSICDYATCHMSHVTCHMSNAYVDPWDMLNNFSFHVYAQMLMFMGENDNGLFWTSLPSPVTGLISNHIAGFQVKTLISVLLKPTHYHFPDTLPSSLDVG